MLLQICGKFVDFAVFCCLLMISLQAASLDPVQLRDQGERLLLLHVGGRGDQDHAQTQLLRRWPLPS